MNWSRRAFGKKLRREYLVVFILFGVRFRFLSDPNEILTVSLSIFGKNIPIELNNMYSYDQMHFGIIFIIK